MKLLYDHLGFMEKFGGVSRYFCNMIQHLPPEIIYDVSLKYSSNEYLPLIKKDGYKHFINFTFPHKERFYSELNKPNSIHSIKKGDYDIYHMTHVDPYGFKYVPLGKKKVMTVHDLNMYMLPGIVRDTFSLKVWQRESANLCDAFIAVSKNTKNDMIAQWHIAPEKITVIYHGLPKVHMQEIAQKKIINCDYILYVGARSNFKNFILLSHVFSKIIKSFPEVKLVCTGSPFTSDERRFFAELGIESHIIHRAVNDAELFSLYHHALCYIYPSLYEGFGMPILEAMSCGCAVACSYASCFPEIAGEAAQYFDPYSESDMISQLSDVIASPELRKKLVAKGFENCKRFSWEICGKEHAAFYEYVQNDTT